MVDIFKKTLYMDSGKSIQLSINDGMQLCLITDNFKQSIIQQKSYSC